MGQVNRELKKEQALEYLQELGKDFSRIEQKTDSQEQNIKALKKQIKDQYDNDD